MKHLKAVSDEILSSEQITCDVLIVGGGIAGFRAAWEAYNRGASVVIAVKGAAGSLGVRGSGASSCGRSELGQPKLPRMPSRKEPYDPDAILGKIVTAGLGTVDRSLASVLVEDVYKERRVVEELGVPLSRPGPLGLGFTFVQTFFGALKQRGACILDHCMITRLFLGDDGAAIGALALKENGGFYRILFRSVILAAGGDAQVYRWNVHPSCCTGDGYALALEAGATLVNMEFAQIFLGTSFPTANLFHPMSHCIEEMKNGEGDLFLDRYLPEGTGVSECVAQHLKHHPFSTRDSLSRYLYCSILSEICEGRADTCEGVTLDLRGKAHGQSRTAVEFFRYRGIDIDRDPLHLTVVQQCCNGGVLIDTDGSAGIPGLYAAGENTSGMHGADRLGGQMLASGLVFGARAGEAAAQWAVRSRGSTFQTPEWSEEAPFFVGGNEESAVELTRELRIRTWSDMMLMKDRSSLDGILRLIEETSDRMSLIRVDDPVERTNKAELKSLLIAAEMTARSALCREESRGGHYRLDYPLMKEDWQCVIEIRKTDSGQTLSKRVIDPSWEPSPDDLGEARWG